jgi:hypothetical protein
MKDLKTIEEKIHKLPPNMLDEVDDFVDFLLSRAKTKGKNKLKQDWAGSLKEFSDKYTSISLQKKSMEWRNK